MNATRRGFLAGGTAFALGGWRLFAVPPGWKPKGTPNLAFGVISDTHLVSRPFAGKPDKGWPHKYLAAALEYFKEQNVDAVVHCGDMAHRGRVREMEFHASLWNRVFPKGRAPDGHEVVKLFVSGNHEFRRDCAGHKLCDKGVDVNWERIWGEPYDRVWHKEVKGYHFFGRHWGASESRMVEMVREWRGGAGADARPFFFVSHSILGNVTCKALGQCRNAVGFFGHWHHSAANWREIYFMKGSSFPCIHVPPCHPHGDGSLAHGKSLFKIPIQGAGAAGRGRQGYVVRVYEDMLVIERREFGAGGSLGADWVVPFDWGTGNGERGTEKKAHPFSMSELRKVIGTPQFRDGAKLVVEEVLTGLTGLTGLSEALPQTQNPDNLVNPVKNASAPTSLRVKIPLADGNPKSRVYAYLVEVAGNGERGMGNGRRVLLKAVYAAGCNMGMGHEPNGGVTELVIPKSELPSGETLTITATPFTSLGTRGKPITAKWSRA